MAKFSFTYTDTDIIVTVEELSIGDRVQIVVRHEPDIGYMTIDDIPTDKTPVTSSVEVYEYFGCLTPSTDYVVTVRTVPSGASFHNAPWIAVENFTTDKESSDEVADWDWAISNGSASAVQTQLAYVALTSQGKLSDFSYLVWNDIVNKAYEVVADRKGEWNTTYGTLEETLMTPTDKQMTAQRFNAVVWNLAQYKTPLNGLTRKSKGDIMRGSYFIDLTDSINNTIYRV